MEEEYDISLKFRKRKKPEVPSGFFENFYHSLKDEIDANDVFLELKLVKRKKPVLPENFDPTFKIDLSEKTELKPSRRGRIIRMSFISAVASAAAILTILFYMNQKETPAEITKTETAIPADEETVDTYIAYLDEDEMIDYILENDINVGEEEDEIYDYVESDIEDIYLDL